MAVGAPLPSTTEEAAAANQARPGPPVPRPRSESYKWYDLPFCHPKKGIQWKTLGMGEVRRQLAPPRGRGAGRSTLPTAACACGPLVPARTPWQLRCRPGCRGMQQHRHRQWAAHPCLTCHISFALPSSPEVPTLSVLPRPPIDPPHTLPTRHLPLPSPLPLRPFPPAPPKVVDSNRMSTTPYDLAFKVPRTNEVACNKTLNAEELRKFRDVRRAWRRWRWRWRWRWR
jgi:hypothetical protein